MTTIKSALMCGVAAVAISAAPVSAQDTNAATDTTTTGEASAQGSGFDSAYGESSLAQIAERDIAELVGTSVLNDAGESVGDVEDFGIAGDQLVAIVGIGGFLGLGEHSVALPIEQMEFQNDQLVMPGVTREQLEALPEYDSATTPSFGGQGTLRGNYDTAMMGGPASDMAGGEVTGASDDASQGSTMAETDADAEMSDDMAAAEAEAEDAAEQAGDAVAEAGDAAENAGEAVAEETAEAGDAAMEAGEQAAENAGDAMAEAGETVEDAGEAVAEETAEAGDAAMEAGSEAADDVAAAGEEAAEATEDAAQDVAQAADQAQDEATEEMAEATDGEMAEDSAAAPEDEVRLTEDSAASAEGDTEMAEGAEAGAEGDAQMAEGAEAGAEAETEMAEDSAAGAEGGAEMAESQGAGSGWTSDMDARFADLADQKVVDLLGMEVAGADGNVVGEVDNFALMQEKLVAIVGVGGFLGIGQHEVALSLDEMNFDGERLVLPSMTEEQLREMPEYDETTGNAVDGESTLRNSYPQE